MRKNFFFIVLIPMFAFANGPKYTYQSPPSPPGLDDEMNNIYHDIRTTNTNLRNSTVFVNVQTYGAKGDGLADDTAAIQAALNASIGETLYFPGRNYKISNALQLNTGNSLEGSFRMVIGTGTIITQSSTTPIFVMPNTGNTNNETSNVSIQGFDLVGGSSQIVATNGATSVDIRDVEFNTPILAGIYTQGFDQSWYVRDYLFIGGNYGVYIGSMTGNGGTGSPSLFDKNNFYNGLFNHQTINAIYLAPSVGHVNTFLDTVVQTSGKDGIVLGSMPILEFINLNTEGIGNSQISSVVTSTATANVGSATVTVGTTGYVNGSTLTIAAAGSLGGDWYPVVQSGGGTQTLTMTTTALSSSTNTEVTNALYSDVKYTEPCVNCVSGDQTFINMSIGLPGALGYTRYAIDGTNMSNNVSIITPNNNRPIYDPNNVVTIMGPNASAQNQSTYSIRPSTMMVGTYMFCSQPAATNFPATGTYGDVCSFTLTPGDWDINVNLFYATGGSISLITSGVGTVSGNNGTGIAAGITAGYTNSTVTNGTIVVPRVEVNTFNKVPQTYYLKVYANYSGGTPTYQGIMTARRVN